MKKEFKEIKKSKYFKYIIAFGIIKKVILLILLFIPLVSFGQDTIPATKILTQKEAYMNKMLELKKDYNTKDRYVIYPTENIYTSLLLDTQTGRIWQIQIGIGDNSDRMRSVLSDNYYSYDEYQMKIDYEINLKEWEDTPEEERGDWYQDLKPNLEDYKNGLGKIGQYKLYPTNNMYNFIMVNTELGYTYQVQWNIDKDLRFVTLIW